MFHTLASVGIAGFEQRCFILWFRLLKRRVNILCKECVCGERAVELPRPELGMAGAAEGGGQRWWEFRVSLKEELADC